MDFALFWSEVFYLVREECLHLSHDDIDLSSFMLGIPLLFSIVYYIVIITNVKETYAVCLIVVWVYRYQYFSHIEEPIKRGGKSCFNIISWS